MTDAIDHVGGTHEDLEDEASARQFYEEALENDPDYVPAMYVLGTLEEGDGRVENAIRFYTQAVETKIPDERLDEQFDSQRDAKRRLYELSEHRELVTIVRTHDQAEAEFLGAHLEAEGFVVFIEEDEDPAVTDDVVEIMVPPDEANDALACIEPLRGLAKYVVGDESGNVDTGYGECTKCKSRDLTPEAEDMGWRDFLILFRLSKPRRILICNECGFEWIVER